MTVKDGILEATVQDQWFGISIILHCLNFVQGSKEAYNSTLIGNVDMIENHLYWINLKIIMELHGYR